MIADGTYTGPGNVDIDFSGKNITVTSKNGAASTIIDCGGYASHDGSGDHRGFYLHSGETAAVINGFTIEHGLEILHQTGAGITVSNSSASIQNCIISETYGSGIYVSNYSYDGSKIAVTDCMIYGNNAHYGAGFYSDSGVSLNGVINLTRCIFMANSSDYGGGFYNSTTSGSNTNITLASCTLVGNSVTALGGGIYNIVDTSITGSAISLTDCNFAENSADSGGGIYSQNGIGTATLTNCNISGNSGQGGGYYIEGGGPTTFLSCAILDNTARNAGAGIFNGDGMPTLVNCTLTGNSAGGSGRGLYSSSGTAIVTNCSLTKNSAQSGAGIYLDTVNGSGTLTLTNDILYNDLNSELTVSDGSAPSTNFCDIHGLSGILGGSLGSSNIDADPLFVSATNFHLQTASPCLSAGTATSAPATDKGGTPRPDPPSIGAYESLAALNGTTHLLWKNASGQATVWTISGDGSVVSTAALGPNNGMNANSIADGTNGAVQLLWKSPAGAASIWTIAPDGTHTSTPTYGPYGDWQAQALAVGTDNLTRLLWKNAAGSCTVWTIGADGTVVSTPTYGPYPSSSANGQWQAQGLAVGADNRTRLFWKNTEGAASVWTFAVDGTYIATPAFGPFGDWQAQALAVGPDDLTRLLWKNAAGSCTVWTIGLDGIPASTIPFGPYPSAASSSDWQAQAFAVGGDGLTRLFWKDAAGSCTVWSLGLDGTATSTVPYGPYGDWQATAIAAGN